MYCYRTFRTSVSLALPTMHTSSGVNGPFPVRSLKLSEDNFENEGCENCVTLQSGEVLHVGIVRCCCSAKGKVQLCRIFTKGLRPH